MSRTIMLWLLWITVSAAGGLYVIGTIFYGGNRSFLLIGRTTDGHHQIELACDACHTSVFGGAEVLQRACVNCHGAELKLANDAHPQSKFTDPRNAERTAILDARYCVTCHREHRPGVTQAMGVTQPVDYCILCHRDIAEQRPSHKGLEFITCASAGCHNFHDNRALYETFLRDRRNEPPQMRRQKVALVEFLESTKKDAIKVPRALAAADADAPIGHRSDGSIIAGWAADAHARAGVNCSGCHTANAEPASWIERPGPDTCKTCHAVQARTFTEGKHGMRLADGVFATRDGPLGLFKQTKLPPMTPAQARLPMKSDKAHVSLGCNACHGAHHYDLAKARVEACMGCHDDAHTRSYSASSHYQLLRKEEAGLAPKGSGVSCATCHMPITEVRSDDGSKTAYVTHNQNDNLRPNEKMVRSVCGNCHGLQFTLDALADPALIANSFNGSSAVHIESIEWAVRRAEERRNKRRRKDAAR